MKKSLLILLLLSFILISYSQKGVITLNSAKNAIEINENNYDKLSLTFNHSQIRSFSVKTEEGTFDEIVIPGARFTGKIGDPKLPAYSKLVEIPFGAEISVKVKSFSVDEYKLSDFDINNAIIPAQPDVNKTEDILKAKFHYNKEAYTSKSFSSYNMTNIEIQGVMRGVRIAKLSVSPVNYNPIEGTIKVYNNIEVEINLKNSDVSKSSYLKKSTFSPYFQSVYAKLLNNKTVVDDHADLVKYPVKMLILADRMFEEALVPYISWKIKKGFNVIVKYTDEDCATVDEIKTWIQTEYDAGTPESPSPSFCLFVGDVAQIPASQTGVNSGRKTDLYYFSQDGDYFPEMYYGRFSANNVAQLQPQIDKTLYYERYEFSDPSYLDDVTLIAGADGTWNPNVGQPTVKYGTQNYFNTAHGFSTVNTYLDSYSGCYDDEKIAVSFINYTAHCNEVSWQNPALSISNVNSFTNIDKYPLAVGNCCMSADFGYGECIGEAWMRAENKGAVAYIGSSPSSYWFEDFYWAVGAFPISGDNGGYVPTVEETTLGVTDILFGEDYVSVDAAVFLGNLVVTEVDVAGYPQHSNPLYYWEAYNCLGDPSLITYRTQGKDNEVSHLPTFPMGLDFFTVDALPGSYVAISKDGVLHGAALVDGTGTVDVPIIPIISEGVVNIVVTKPQYIPYIETIDAVVTDGPYVIINSCKNEVDFGESINLDISLKNVGAQNASSVSVSISTTDINATITNSTTNFGDIASDETTSESSNVFTLAAADDIPNKYKIPVDITIASGSDTWEQTKYILVNAPEITIGNVSVINDDNEDEILDPGETGDLVFSIKNSGNADANFEAILSKTSDPDNYLTLGTTSVNNITISAGESSDFVFANVSPDEDTPLESSVELSIDVKASSKYTKSSSQELIIGLIPVYLISDEGTFSVCKWKFYDSGKDSNYKDYEDYTITFIVPEGEDKVTVNFTKFDIESESSCNFDNLMIYDGSDINADLIGKYCGTESPGIVEGENGLTFRFKSDTNTTRAGWVAEVSCSKTIKIDNISDKVSIYPNPTNGFFNINLNELKGENTKVEVVSISGQTVFLTQTNEDIVNVDLNNYSKGIYFVKILSEKGVVNYKIVLQ